MATPTDGMKTEAQRGLDWRREFGRGGTEVGIARARDIKNGVNLSDDTIKRMYSYFSRHEVDKQGEGFSPGEDGYPSNGRIAWALWGGDAGFSWSKAQVAKMDRSDYTQANQQEGERMSDIEVNEEVAVEEVTTEETVAEEIVESREMPGDFDENIQDNQEVARLYENEVIHRADDMQAEAVDDRRVRMAISSELPVKRSFGMEVLDHSEESIDLEFLNSGRAPLLMDHDPERQIGVIESVDLDGSARRLRATVRFGRNGLAREVYDDVVDKIRGNVSIGYAIDKMVRDESDKNVYRATQWRPMEASIVSIPADASVGVGRKAEISEEPKPEIPNVEITKMENTEINVDQVRQDAAASRTKEINEIFDLAAKHNKRDLADKAIREGATAAQFRHILLDAIADKPMEQVDLGMNEKEVRQYSLTNAIRAMASGKFGGFEAEVSQELADKYGREARGFYVPTDIFKRDLTVGSATAGGNLVGTDHLGGEFIDALRAQTVMSALGAQMMQGLKGDVAIPALNAKTAVGFVAENNAPGSEGAPTFRQVTMSPKTMVQYVDMSRKLMAQSDPSVEQIIRNDMIRQFAAKLDEVTIEGGGTNEPTGILGTSGIGSVAMGTNGDALDYASCVNLEKEVAIDNALGGRLGFLTNPKVIASMRQTARQSSGVEGNFILNDTNNLLGYGVTSSTLVPSDLTKGTGTALSALIFGNFSDVMIGMWGGLDILVDPYTGSSTGATRVAMYQDVDVAVRHAESFAAIKDIVA